MRRLIGLMLHALLGSPEIARSETCETSLTYLSSSIEVYTYLENLQRELYESNPGLIHDPYLREQLRDPASVKTWDEVTERLIGQGIIDRAEGDTFANRLRCSALPTKYESPLTFILLQVVLDELEDAGQANFPDAKEVYFGTLPTATIQAQAMVPPGFSAPIIILNRDVFQFTAKFSKVISAAIPISRDHEGNVTLTYDEQRIRSNLKENPSIIEDFAQAVFLLVTSGSPAAAHEEALDKDHNLLHARLVGGLDSFIIGHELGHILLRHTASTRSYAFPVGDTTDEKVEQTATTNVTLTDYEGNQELAADDLSLRLFIKSRLKHGTDGLLSASIGAAGGDLFFAIIDLHDKLASTLGLSPMHGGKHPPAALRSANLDKVFGSHEMTALGLHELPDFRLLTRTSFKVLSEAAEPQILKALELYSASR